jgi:hypothetical protein
VHTHHSMIAVTGPAGLPFVVAYCRHVEVPATETLASAPIPAAASSQQQQQQQQPSPGSHPHAPKSKQSRSKRRGGDNKRQSGETHVVDREAGRNGGVRTPVVSPPAPSKDKCYLPVREPIYSRYNQKSRTSVAMIPCLGHGRWIVTAACLRSDLTRLAPQHEMVGGAARTRQPDGGKAFFLLPRVSNMQQQPHGAARAANATAPSAQPSAMTDSDDDAPCSNDEGEDEGPRHHPEPRVELNANERAELVFPRRLRVEPAGVCLAAVVRRRAVRRRRPR